MSDHVSSEGEPAVGAFSRWPGLLSLTLGVLLGPSVALANQELIYLADDWTCGRGMRGVVHLVPALCLVVVIATGMTAFRDWRAVGGGVNDDDATLESRTRFVALLGIASSVFSALVILAQWAAAFVFDRCMRI